MLRRAFISTVFFVILSVLGGVDTYAQQNREYPIKASLIHHFTKYIDWPLPYQDEENFTIGIFENDADMIPHLEDLTEFKRAKNRMIILKQYSPKSIPNANELEYCDMFFISKKNKDIEDKIISIADKTNTLLVGETKNFTQRGGSIGFFIKNNKINIAINRNVVEQATYKISPQLLRIAVLTKSEE